MTYAVNKLTAVSAKLSEPVQYRTALTNINPHYPKMGKLFV
jgi:hypothetical protein